MFIFDHGIVIYYIPTKRWNQLLFSRTHFFSPKFEPQIALLNHKHITRMISVIVFDHMYIQDLFHVFLNKFELDGFLLFFNLFTVSFLRHVSVIF